MNAYLLKRVTEHVQYRVDRIRGLDLELFVSSDASHFHRTKSDLQGTVHPALDPTRNYLGADNFFWIQVTEEGEPVACVANRLYAQENLLHLIHSRRIWGDHAPRLDIDQPVPGLAEPELACIDGRLSLQGGAYVTPRHRGSKLGFELIALARALSFRHWFEDWQFGLVVDKVVDNSFNTRFYQYPGTCRTVGGTVDWGPKNDSEHCIYASRADAISLYSSAPATFGLTIETREYTPPSLAG